MPNWNAITIDTLYEAKIAKLIDAVNTRGKAVGQDDRAAGIIQDAVDTVRNYVAGCKANVLDSDVTKVPKELKSIAVRMAIWDLKNALEMEVTEAETIDHSKDIKRLEMVAACDLPVALADDPETAPEVQPTILTPAITPKNRKFTDCSQDGI